MVCGASGGLCGAGGMRDQTYLERVAPRFIDLGFVAHLLLYHQRRLLIDAAPRRDARSHLPLSLFTIGSNATAVLVGIAR